MIVHLAALGDSVQKLEKLNEHANAVLLLRTPGDASVTDAGSMQREEIGVKAHQDALFGSRVIELIGVGQSM